MSTLGADAVYLHFLDRELLSSIRLYAALSVDLVRDDVVIGLASTYEPLYLSASLVFENRFARYLIHHMRDLFQLGEIRIALHEPSLGAFVVAKQAQYEHAKEDYAFYFDDTWRRILDLGSAILPRATDTTIYLAERLPLVLSGAEVATILEKERLPVPEVEIARLADPVAETLESRGSLAVTARLFERSVTKASISERGRGALAMLISDGYIRSYMDEYNGTIFTGLACGVPGFEYLCRTYPVTDLVRWRSLYSAVNLLAPIRAISTSDMLVLRHDSDFRQFLDYARAMFRSTTDQTLWSAHMRELRSRRWGEVRANADAILQRISLLRQRMETSERQDVPRRRTVKPDERTVFVVHGRDDKLRESLFAFLRSAGLHPLEWEQAVALTGEAAPYVGTVLDRAFEKAMAIVVLFSPEEDATLRDTFRHAGDPHGPQPQPRPNVVLEAGMALGRNPNRTVIVQVGDVRNVSDLAGRHFVYLRDTVEQRKALLTRLQSAGCAVNMAGNDWLKAGTFPP